MSQSTDIQATGGQSSFTIGELADLASVTPRTIRYYTAEGLLPQPDSDGRYARYGADHLNRLRLIAQFKEAYLPLHEIRQRIAALDAAQITTMLDTTPPLPRRIAEPSSAAEYLADVIARQQVVQPTTPGASPLHTAATLVPRPIQAGTTYALLDAQAQPSGEHWQRIVLRPGVELHVREPLDRAAHALVEQVQRLVRL